MWSQKTSNCLLLIYAPHWITGAWYNCTPCNTGTAKPLLTANRTVLLNVPLRVSNSGQLVWTLMLLKTLRKNYRKLILFLHKFFLRLCKCSLSGIFVAVRCKLICTSLRWNNMQSEHTFERNTVIIPLLFHKTSSCIIKIIFLKRKLLGGDKRKFYALLCSENVSSVKGYILTEEWLLTIQSAQFLTLHLMGPSCL